jgi:RNA polymerase sigma-70 factor (ECF subfamily)
MIESDPPASFPTTRWSLVARAGDRAAPEARAALEELCRAYWYPLYALMRRGGHPPEDAEDLVQGLLADLLERGDLTALDRSKGRFRSFLRAAAAHYLSNRRDRDRALKRGGGRKAVPLDLDDAEARYRLEPSHGLTAERLFERRWALTVLERVLRRLEAELEACGKAALFARLKPALQGDDLAPPFREVGTDLGMTEGSVRTAAHRLRARYRELLRDEVARSVDDPGDVDEEIAALLDALAAR